MGVSFRLAFAITGSIVLASCAKTVTEISGSHTLVSAEPLQFEFPVSIRQTPDGTIEQFTLSPLTVKGREKEYLGYVLLDSGKKCQRFADQLSAIQRGVDTSFDIVTTVLSALATAITPLSTVHGLTAGATISSGTKLAIDADVYAKASAALILQEIDRTYYVRIQEYRSNLSSRQDVDRIIPSIEVGEIEAIHRKCSLDAAITSLSQTGAVAAATIGAATGAAAGAVAAAEKNLPPATGAIGGALAGATAGAAAAGAPAASQAAATAGAKAGAATVEKPNVGPPARLLPEERPAPTSDGVRRQAQAKIITEGRVTRTPPVPVDFRPPNLQPGEMPMNLSTSDVANSQAALGISPNGDPGVPGSPTRKAVGEFQRGMNARDPLHWPAVSGLFTDRETASTLPHLLPMPREFKSPFERAYLGNYDITKSPREQLTRVAPIALRRFLERSLGVPKEQLQEENSEAAVQANMAIMRDRIEKAQAQPGSPPGEKGVLDAALYDYLKRNPLPKGGSGG